MKTKQLTGFILSTLAAVALQQATAQPLNLHTNVNQVYTNNFDSLLATNNPLTPGSLPGEWTVYTGATSESQGTVASFDAGLNMDGWTNPFTGAFKNYAGIFDYIGGTNFTGDENGDIQTNEPNRCLGIRQIGSFGDPGASFVLKLQDTTNLHNFSVQVDLLNLDPTSTRQTTWTFEYGYADPVFLVPIQFFPVAYYTNVPGTFNSVTTNIAFPDGTINNFNGQVWLRITALQPSDFSGNRESFAIDNYSLSWAIGTGGFTRVLVSGNPSPVTVYSNATATFTVTTTGTSPVNYQWLKDGVPLNNGGNISGAQAFQLFISQATTTDQGTYSCIASNYNGTNGFVATSHGATLTVTNPPIASIGFLRTLVDTNFAATNSTLFWHATGMITTATNTTSGNTASYYLQDDTGGINLFVTGGSSFRPNQGDIVTAIGFLSSFGGNLELEADLTGAIPARNATLVQILSNNIAAFPAPKILSWDGLGKTPTNADLQLNYVGSVVLLTNLYFGTNTGKLTPPPPANRANQFYWVSNLNAQFTQLAVYTQQDNDLTNRILPAFAYFAEGPLIAFAQPSIGKPTNGNYEIAITRWSDIVTNPLTIATIVRTNANPTITWTAVPVTFTYSVLAAPELTGPFTPIATGLKFSTPAGNYTDPSATTDHKFYRITSP